MKKQIQIKICPDGKVIANTLGILGIDCVDYKDILEKLLEAKTESVEYTEEYYQSVAVISEELIQERGSGN